MKLQATICALLLTGAATLSAEEGNFKRIVNDTFWDTIDHHPLYSQGGGIFRFPAPDGSGEKYYWYGVRYTACEAYRRDPSVTLNDAVFEAVTCYSSDNLTDWTYEGDVLTRAYLDSIAPVGWVGRLGVAYIAEKESYALLVQYGGGLGSGVLVTLSDTPTGHFTWHQLRDMTATIGTPSSGDQTVFTDPDDGRSYLVYSYGKGRNKIYVSEIGVNEDGRVDLLDCTQVFKGESREGNCMFKYNGHYYMCASNIYGWDGSYAYYLMADDIRGPYLPTNDMQVMAGCEADYAHVSQTGFFYTLRRAGRELVLFCGDRWCDFAGNGLGYNQWVPLSFDAEDRPYFNSLSAWSLNEATAEWRVDPDNNYVRNGSFEADRRPIPNPVKPRQEFLLGWETEVLKGHRVAVGDSLSPQLNYLNSQADRREVIGEKSLCISDTEPFTRRVTQTITSSPYVALPDGEYTLRAKVRCSGRFKRLEMWAESDGRKSSRSLRKVSDAWTEVVLEHVPVRGGRVVIGFDANGKAGARCLVDDVSLRRQ
jgi:hypothetical protein